MHTLLLGQLMYVVLLVCPEIQYSNRCLDSSSESLKHYLFSSFVFHTSSSVNIEFYLTLSTDPRVYGFIAIQFIDSAYLQCVNTEDIFFHQATLEKKRFALGNHEMLYFYRLISIGCLKLFTIIYSFTTPRGYT